MILVDTTVIIDIWRGKLNIKKRLESYPDEVFGISAITIEEIYDGLGYTKKEKGKEIYQTIKKQYEKILQNFEIVPVTTEILKKTGLLRGELRKSGDLLDLADIIIMITAQEVKASRIITRNPTHFNKSPIGVESYKI
ncbi:MAG: type II toxin-antitoxin system VapC family toxin [Promethearchaeia archaeon]